MSSENIESDDSSEDDFVTPGRAYWKQKKQVDEIQAAKQFIISSSLQPNSDGRRANLVKNRTLKSQKPRANANLLLESESEEDSLKSEINTLDMNKYDSPGRGTSNMPNMSSQQDNADVKDNHRGTNFFKRQQIHLEKKKTRMKDTPESAIPEEEDKTKTGISKRKTRALRRKDTLFKGNEAENEYEYEDIFSRDGQRLRDIYKNAKCVLFQDDPYKEKQEIMTTIILLFACIHTPYRIAFSSNDNIFWALVDNFTDGYFAIDMILTFFTAYEHP